MVISFVQKTPLQSQRIRGKLAPEAVPEMIATAVQTLDTPFLNLMIAEHNWIHARRPFFNVYPSVLKSLLKTSLRLSFNDVPKSIFHDLKVLCVKLPQPPVDSLADVPFFFMQNGAMNDCVTGKTTTESSIHIGFSDAANAIFGVEIPADRLISDWTDADNEDPKYTKEERERTRLVIRIAVGVMLLAADPDYIRPVLLKRDRGKPDLDTCIERARRRGVFGFDIGKGQESSVSPHWRRPHFAIRWTGKGKAIPKLVPVKAARIGDADCLKVPTGFEDAGGIA